MCRGCVGHILSITEMYKNKRNAIILDRVHKCRNRLFMIKIIL